MDRGRQSADGGVRTKAGMGLSVDGVELSEDRGEQLTDGARRETYDTDGADGDNGFADGNNGFADGGGLVFLVFRDRMMFLTILRTCLSSPLT